MTHPQGDMLLSTVPERNHEVRTEIRNPSLVWRARLEVRNHSMLAMNVGFLDLCVDPPGDTREASNTSVGELGEEASAMSARA